MGLVADSLDMLADAFVYGLSLYAIGHSTRAQHRITRLSGYFQITLAVLGFLEVLRRFSGLGEVPDFRTMIIISILALGANLVSLLLLQKNRDKGVHMKASWIFTSNDVLVNLGVIIAGILVFSTGSGLPDLIVGSIVFIIVSQGAARILKLSDQPKH